MRISDFRKKAFDMNIAEEFLWKVVQPNCVLEFFLHFLCRHVPTVRLLRLCTDLITLLKFSCENKSVDAKAGFPVLSEFWITSQPRQMSTQ